MRHGGDKIKRKLLLSVLLLFGLALILNVNLVSAANITTDHTQPKITAVNPASNTIITNSKPIILTFNETIKPGSLWIELKDGKTSIPIKKSVNGNTLIITPVNPLKTSIKYNIVVHTNSITDLSGNGNNPYTSLFTVSSLTLAQMKDGLNRAQIFYNEHNRLPTYVSFGSKKIVIIEFQKIITTQGLKIKTINDKSESKDAGTVTAAGWNSCCSGWYKTSGTFINYCPLCHSYSCLTYNPKHTYEGEWTCTKCDADYCICGRCKATGSNAHLITA
ncbi:MAG: Ig-like domain-containing protein [Methanobacterium sp.]|uniref:Ig-like domain-containing protein n=1 Tax=Methanobacterium sp. TaxID=2164 RepID=UPI003C737537